MPKRTTVASPAQEQANSDFVRKSGRGGGLKVTIVTMDNHLASAAQRSAATLSDDIPGLRLSLHAASEFESNPCSVGRCINDIETADIVITAMLFVEDHYNPIISALRARREKCDALVCLISAPEVSQLTHMGSLDMSRKQGGGMRLLKKLRGSKQTAEGGSNASKSGGAKQMAMLRRLPKILRFIPGTAQDLRFYFLSMQYWLLGSDINIANMVKLLAVRYSSEQHDFKIAERDIDAPREYPDIGLYHPRIKNQITTDPKLVPEVKNGTGTVGLVVMRSYLLAGNAAHYDGVIEALEAKGLSVMPVFASGLDARPAIEAYFMIDGVCKVDAVLSLTGFSLVGGPAYNDCQAAQDMLAELNVPYVSALALEFQSIAQWQDSERGLLPLETMMMVAIPELDGATGTMVYGGRENPTGVDVQAHPERTSALADRMHRLVSLRKRKLAERKIAVVLYDFPPNSGATGSAAYLGVFESLYNVLGAMADEGYAVEVPESAAALQNMVLKGNAQTYGTPANVCARIDTDTHVAREAHLEEIEAQWGPAPGRLQTDGRSILILGAQLGNVFVGVQPAFGYEGDPMKLMFERGMAPTHAFSAFYQHIREDFAADALLHFGTHGALEFMPGKQVGMSAACWPERLVGSLPHVYLYAANNPSEAAIAKRRSNATTVTYLTPLLSKSGLYKGLQDLKDLVQQHAQQERDTHAEGLLDMLREQAAELELMDRDSELWATPDRAVAALSTSLIEMESTLVPHGLHVLGTTPSSDRVQESLEAIADASDCDLPEACIAEIAQSETPEPEVGAGSLSVSQKDLVAKLIATRAGLLGNNEIPAVLRALNGEYIRPVAGGDLLRNSQILPTGRNVHGFDPSRMPSAFSVAEGARQANQLLAKCCDNEQPLPKRLAIVLWGTDNLKNGGVGISEAMALMGTRPRFDTYGRLAGAELISLEELGRARVDVLVTVSGIFRDLLPRQVQILAEAAQICAAADEPLELNPVRALALECAEAMDISLEDAALRVFGNAESTYGANVNMLVDNAMWQSEEELGDMFMLRRCFAYGVRGEPVARPELLTRILAVVDVTFQNLDSVELGITTLDHYVDSLGGVSRAVANAKGASVPTLVGDFTQGKGAVRSLADQVALESRTRILNPSWYESMLEHGHEGVHQIEAHFVNFVGWSATTGQVAPWVYKELSQTYLLDKEMRDRLAALNPLASLKMAQRMIEASERDYWTSDDETMAALHEAGEALEDIFEGVDTSMTEKLVATA